MDASADANPNPTNIKHLHNSTIRITSADYIRILSLITSTHLHFTHDLRWSISLREISGKWVIECLKIFHKIAVTQFDLARITKHLVTIIRWWRLVSIRLLLLWRRRWLVTSAIQSSAHRCLWNARLKKLLGSYVDQWPHTISFTFAQNTIHTVLLQQCQLMPSRTARLSSSTNNCPPEETFTHVTWVST